MTTLLIPLGGPMQSWGTRSRFDDRDTGAEPSKSGVLGLCAAALGIDRGAPITHLSALRFGVRVDRAGVLMHDYHTAQLHPQQRGSGTSLTRRAYLADAAFWAGLSGDGALLRELHAALRDPHWPLSLGRKAFVPAIPLWFPEGLRPDALLPALRGAPTLRRREGGGPGETGDDLYRLVVDRAEVGEPPLHATPGERRDDPSAPFLERRYALRDVIEWAEALPHLHRPPEVSP
ncbi:type I-E CRISPR-associated protein Cas5/CasD [Deinococcus metallilatus]|uniref:CRISPR system Cascade subunit CasD n=1 Tax=Deinococcus metallilatus TaxID=1211322 RepID=A0AAJ5JYV9_9DEIO|nr:type I-E CRISPR-associated protein Cas5/CasD [Deinococcus metallilatus]MBB5294931.1 CRISPR system Cascade subunit CasD [Deinococcus metallilatus]QBY09364.1 type I-E CRISPR-associated protein Cas5/CasD [Deinococcus metallilatus]RXJ09369.1 type I-E CRISPR-associated protein Cas5/CasD [Deinococcus metallilatus]TLK28891.1 type I-E CRISPR-associated protein Cas5/CasD [Deinococcus metallilatus]GMA16861.1 type I-E CRISPR-associated protein Cas5/CasD [Deinococcus metallilatus]